MSVKTSNWVRDQFRNKRFKLSDTEKLILLALADSPSSFEYLIEEYDLKSRSTEKALAHLQQMGLIYYVERNADYAYGVWMPEDVHGI